jgi:hypothetical protein
MRYPTFLQQVEILNFILSFGKKDETRVKENKNINKLKKIY